MLQPGDIFLLEPQEPDLISDIVKEVSGWWSVDGKAECTHSGLIINEAGDTIESAPVTSKLNMFTDHASWFVQIWRCDTLSPLKAQLAINELIRTIGEIYPFWRLGLFAGGLARWWHGHLMVCSELTTKFICLACPVHPRTYWGMSPDDLHDWLQANREWAMIYRGKGRGIL